MTRVHYDEELDISFQLIEITEDNLIQTEFKDADDCINHILKSQPELAYGSIYNGIRVMLENSFNHVPCFSIQDLIFEIKIEEVHEKIDECLSYFETTEDYETCTELIRMRNFLKDE